LGTEALKRSSHFDENKPIENAMVGRLCLIRSRRLLPIFLLLSASAAPADFIETFSTSSNVGNWRLTDNPARLL
jgi:hypothetical protein